MVKVGLINNRHPMPVQNYIFEKEIENVFDFESIKNEIKFVVCNSCTCTSVCCVWSGINFNAL